MIPGLLFCHTSATRPCIWAHPRRHALLMMPLLDMPMLCRRAASVPGELSRICLRTHRALSTTW